MAERELKNYRVHLQIQKHRLDDELEIQAQMLDDVGSQTITMKSRMLQAEDDLKLIEARLFREYKEDDRATDKTADAMVKQDPERKRAFTAYQAARHAHEEWSVLYEAWKGRRFALGELCGLYVANYFTIDSFGSGREDRPHHKGEDRARQERPAYTPPPRMGLLAGERTEAKREGSDAPRTRRRLDE